MSHPLSSSSSSIASSCRTQPIQNPYTRRSSNSDSNSNSNRLQPSSKSTSQNSSSKSSASASASNIHTQGFSTSSSSSQRSKLTSTQFTCKPPPSSSSPVVPTRTHSPPTKKEENDSLNNLRQALTEYCNNIKNNNHQDVNTSFSVASFAMRQRKLLRNVIYELKQITNLSRCNYSTTISNTAIRSDDDYGYENSNDFDFGGHESFYLKGVGCNSHHEIHFKENDDSSIVENISKVFHSVNKLIIEEYYEQNENDNITEHSHHHQQQQCDDVGINMSYNMMNTTTRNNNDGTSGNSGDNNETLLVALEFLNIAYSCLESNLVMMSLQSLIDCEEFHCVDIKKHGGCDDDENGGSEQNNGDLRSIVDALLYFVMDPNGNGIIDVSYDQSGDDNNHQRNHYGSRTLHEYDNDISFLQQQPTQSNQIWEPSRIQMLAMTALTKAILNTEFLQRYCTSLTILPDDAVDSLLGNDMGIGLASTSKEEMIKIVQMSMCYLSSSSIHNDASFNRKDGRSSSTIPSSTPNYERQDKEMFAMACMSLLTSLFRTNASIWMLVEVPPRLTKKMISNLFQVIEQSRHFDLQMQIKQKSTYILSTLAQSLLLVIEWKSPGSTDMGKLNSIIDDQSILKLTQDVFPLCYHAVKYNIHHTSAVHLFIHLCHTRDEVLKKILNEDDFLRIITEKLIQIIESGTEGDNDNSTFCFIMIHFIEAFPRSRRILCRIFEQKDKEKVDDLSNYQRFFCTILSFGCMTTFNSMIGSTNLFRTLFSLEIRDELVSKSRTLTSALKFDSIINQLLQPYNHLLTCISIDMQLKLCCIFDFIGHLIRFGSKNDQLLQQIYQRDSIIEVTLNVAKFCKNNFCMNNSEHYCDIFCGLLFGATYILGQFCSFCDDEQISPDKQSTLKMIAGQFIRRFESGAEKRSDANKENFGFTTCINFAINQASSRDLTRRVLMFHAAYSCNHREGGRSLDSGIFTAACSKASLATQSSEQHSIYEERLEKLNTQCDKIRRERDAISQELTNKDAYFQQQLHYAKQHSRADAIEKAELISEERNILELKLMSSRNELSVAMKDIKQQKKESKQREIILKKQVDEFHEKNISLEEELAKVRVMLEKKNEDIASRNSNIIELKNALSEIQMKLDKEKYEKQIQSQNLNSLEGEHLCVKEKLEDALSKLIALAKSYIALEQTNCEEARNLRDNVDEANKKKDEVITKYQRLKEIYYNSEEKVKSLTEKIEKMKSLHSQTSKSSQINSKSSSRRRQPMGTLAFMNSIHDTSMRSSGKERNHEAIKTSRKKSSSTLQMRGKSSSHRNIR